MTRFLVPSLLLLGLGLGLGLVACAKPDIAQDLKSLDATERQALTDLLKGTGVAPEGLRPIGLLGIDRNPRALAIDHGHVIGIRLSGVTVTDLEPARRLPLQALWLTGCTLPSLAGLGGHATLRDLSLAGSNLTSLAGLADLPQLREINVDDNKLQSLTELKALPALQKVSARNNQLTEAPALGDKMATKLDGNPLGKDKGAGTGTAAGAAPAAADAPGTAAELPKITGKTTGRGPHSVKGVLRGNPPLEGSGVYESLVGAIYLGMAKSESADPTVDVEITVDTGRVRVYAEPQSRQGFVYAEATPGKPARLNGRMIYGVTSFQLVLESMDGTATGIRYHVIRAKR